ncbi:MAG: ABC transporter permease [Pseudomonadales bacterium]|jgi:ABC-type polysaccharide/polyol phosphate export permease|nr:ABC transporter permease [Pseudomonadales bacterium]
MTNLLTIFTSTHNRQLLFALTKREIAQRYKQSILGYFWVIGYPLVQMLVMSFVFSHIFARVIDIGVPYPIFLFAGLLPWNFFANSLIMSTNSLVDNADLLSKIYFPREILIFSSIMAKSVDLLFSSLIFVAMMIFYQISPTINILWVIPVLLIQIIFTYGLGLITSTFNLFYRDIQYLLNLVVLMWMYLTPVMYPMEIFPENYRWIFQINPMAVLVNAYRDILLNGNPPNFLSLGIALALSIILIIVGFKIFKRLEGQFADAV